MTLQPSSHFSDANWQTFAVLQCQLSHASPRISPSVLAALRDIGSLTARLTELSHNRFSVKVISERWGQAHFDECKTLSINSRSRCLIREVILLGGNEPWVYARSILPATSLCGPMRQLKGLSTRPLGGWLFSQPSMRREPMEFALVKQRSLRVPKLPLAAEERLPGRRSVFYVYDRPILVAEYFLPSLLHKLSKVGN